MKQPENNEIDILLHGLASRERSVPTELAGNVIGAHLDADELNSYAEDALPPSTRARYTSHLADCDDCRKIVTHLSLAAGPLINEATISHSSAAFDWRKMLAGLFAPAMLRYAMPALVLIVVGVAFFALRQPRKDSFIARNSGQSEVSTAAQPGSAATKGQSGSVDQFAEQRKAATPAATHAQSPADKAGESAQKTPDTAKPASSEASTEKEPPKNEVARLTQPTYAPEPAPPPAKPASESETKDSAQVASGIADLKPAAARKRAADRQSESARADASASGAAAADAPAAGKDDDRKKAKALSVARGAVERDEESETRTVGGRHFQRRNNIWVDVAYSSSLSIITVTRGSEQYRALIADEPGIDTIAKQLSGEIKLVWKGHAYHIR